MPGQKDQFPVMEVSGRSCQEMVYSWDKDKDDKEDEKSENQNEA